MKTLSNPNGPEKTYTVVGNICETDTFATDRKISEIREGDYLVFYNAGAYGFEMSSNFNSRLKPAEVMVKDGRASLIRRRDEFEDLLRNQVEDLMATIIFRFICLFTDESFIDFKILYGKNNNCRRRR